MSQSAEKELTVTRTKDKGANEDTSVVFVPTPFARGARKELGIKYPAFPEVSGDTLNIARNFFGDENFFSMLNEAIRLWVQQTYNAVLSSNGDNFDEKLFVQFMEELSTRGETKEEIETALAGIRKQLVEIQEKAEASSDDAVIAGLYAKFGPLVREIKKYDAILASKKRVPRKAKEEEEQAA